MVWARRLTMVTIVASMLAAWTGAASADTTAPLNGSASGRVCSGFLYTNPYQNCQSFPSSNEYGTAVQSADANGNFSVYAQANGSAVRNTQVTSDAKVKTLLPAT